MKKIKINYIVHFHDLTQKPSEQIEVDVKTINELIDLLEERYPGIAPLVREKDGTPNPRNAIILDRQGQHAMPLNSFSGELRDGDILTFI